MSSSSGETEKIKLREYVIGAVAAEMSPLYHTQALKAQAAATFMPYIYKDAGVDIVTIGQYIQPSKAHLPVAKYYTLDEFEDLRKLAQKVGFTNYQIDPLVRSSYKASLSWKDALGK